MPHPGPPEMIAYAVVDRQFRQKTAIMMITRNTHKSKERLEPSHTFPGYYPSEVRVEGQSFHRTLADASGNEIAAFSDLGYV